MPFSRIKSVVYPFAAFILCVFALSSASGVRAEAPDGVDLVEIWASVGVRQKDYVALESRAELDQLTEADPSISYEINGGEFSNGGYTTTRTGSATGTSDQGIKFHINRPIPVVRGYFSFEMKGIAPDSFDQNGDGNPNNDGHYEGTIGGFGTGFDEENSCLNKALGTRFQIQELTYNECNQQYELGEGEDPITQGDLITRPIMLWAGSVNPATKIFCASPLQTQPDEGSENPREIWYRFEYYYGAENPRANAEESDIELLIHGNMYRAGENTPLAGATIPLNWNLDDRDNMEISIGTVGKGGWEQLTFRNVKFKFEDAVTPLYYVPELPNNNPACILPGDENDDDIYDQLSCVSTQEVGANDARKVFYAREDSPISNPRMNLRDRNPKLIDPATLEVNPPPFLSIKLKWRLGNWYMSLEGLQRMPDVSVETSNNSVAAGQSVDVRARNDGYQGDGDSVYTAWCVDGVPNQGLAAGGRLITDTPENLASRYPRTPENLDVVDGHREEEDFDNNGEVDQTLRACCRLVKRAAAKDIDQDGMDDNWEQQYFPTIVKDVTNITQLRQVDPFADPDEDGYDSTLIYKRDGYFYWLAIEPILNISFLENVVRQFVKYFKLEDYNKYFFQDKERPPTNTVPLRVVPNTLATLLINGRRQTIVIKTGECDQFGRDTCKFPNIEEYIWGTNPVKGDTDGDGFSDGEEISGKGAYDFAFTPQIKTASKHTIRATSVGYSQQKLAEIDSDTTNYFISKGGVLDVSLQQTPPVITPSSEVRFDAIVQNNKENENGLVYAWKLKKQDGNEVALDASLSGKGKKTLLVPKEAISAIAIGGTGSLELSVTEESTGKTGTLTKLVFMGDPINIQWKYIPGCKPSAPACNESIGMVEANAANVLSDIEKLNFVWSVNGTRDMNESGPGEEGKQASFNVLPLDRTRPVEIGLNVYRIDTSELITSAQISVNINNLSSDNPGDSGSQRTGFLQGVENRVQASLSSFTGLFRDILDKVRGR